MSALRGRDGHVLVILDGTEPSRRALLTCAAIADEHAAELSVVALVAHERQTWGCGLSSVYWNGVMDDMAERQLATARVILDREESRARYRIVSGAGVRGVRRAADELGCDVVLLAGRGPRHRRLARRVRRAAGPSVVEVRAA